MARESNPDRPSDDPDGMVDDISPIDGIALADDVTHDDDARDDAPSDDAADVASLLADAYDAPAVPKSLVKRLDQGIAEQWGVSPELAPQSLRSKIGLAEKSGHWIRKAAFATGIAASLVLVVFMASGSNNYTWAAVLDALKQQQLIETQRGDDTCWLDPRACVVGCVTSEKTEWTDWKQQFVLTRRNDSDKVVRDSVSIDGPAPSSDAILTAFLLGQPMTPESLERLRDAEVAEQQWDRIDSDGRQLIDYRVRLRTATEDFSLSLMLDPETMLPLATRARDASVAKPLALSYRRETVQQLQAQHFPQTFQVVQSEAGSGESLPPNPGQGEPNQLSPGPDTQQIAADGSPASNANKEDTGVAENRASVANTDLANHSLPIGDANRWAPVAVVPRSDEDVVARVNSLLETLWREKGVTPVEAATDLQMLRRAYLDLAGRSPSVTEVRNFLKDDRGDRYERLVDQLLDSPDHASQLAAVWRSFLIPEGVDLEAFGGREVFEKWLADRFAANEPYDQVVRKLLLAEGRLSQSGPLLFYSALKLDPDQLAARTSRAFLGMRLECAQCHDHPFEAWTQEEFWSYAAFFAQISRPKGELENVSTVMRVHDVDRGEVTLPESDTIIPPRFLGKEIPASGADANSEGAETNEGRRARLAHWLTSADNPYFARATVNRLWSQLMGRGIVDPVDDFGMNNPPVSPELLDTLASQFISSDFDLKSLVRSIALSRAYRLSSSSSDSDASEDDADKRLEFFAQMNVKTLTAEQLYDCIAVATLLDDNAGQVMDYTLSRFGNRSREAFLQQFAAPSTNRSEYLAGIPQALTLMNGALISGATGEQTSGLIRSLQAPFFTDRQRIDVLFMATLSRPATESEAELLAGFVPADATAEQRSAGLADLLWALMNSAEFTLNH